MRSNLEIDVNLARRLDVLRDQPGRDPEKAARARTAYLDLAQQLADSSSQAVTPAEKRRQIGWMHPLQQIFGFPRKEHSPMFGTLATILLIISLALGGSGATAVAAQSSLPDQFLYPVKTWSENVRTGLTSHTQTRLELALTYANRRAEEMQAMLGNGKVPPDAVQARLQAEIDKAMQLAVGQPDNEARRSFEQIRQQLQKQEQAFMGLKPAAGTRGEAILDQTRAMLQDRLHLCDQGIQDPDLLRQQLRDRDKLQDGTGTNSDRAPSGAMNPWTTGTPTPYSGYGPGPGDGSGTNHPKFSGTPTPGSGYGPGPGPAAGTGEPVGAGEPGGNDDPGGNGTGSPQGGEPGGTGPNNGPTNPAPTAGDAGSGGSGSGSGGGTGSEGSGSGGPGGNH